MKPPAAALLALLALLPCCCSEDQKPPVAPASNGARVAGRVSGPSGPLAAWVQAREIRSGDLVAAPTRPDGSYELLLPPGTYLVEAQVSDSSGEDSEVYFSRDGAVNSASLADTLRVTTGTVEEAVDFTLGAVDVLLRMPSAYVGRRLVLRLTPRRGRSLSVDLRSAPPDTNFLFLPCAPGVYSLQLETRDTQEKFWLPGERDRDRAESLLVSPGQYAYYDWYPDHAAAVLAGEIRGSWRTMGLPTPQIRLFDDDSILVASGAADRRGRFRLEPYVGGGMRVQLVESVRPDPQGEGASGDGVYRWMGGGSFAEATRFDLAPGRVIAGVIFEESGLVLRLEGPGTELSYAARVVVAEPSGRIVWVHYYPEARTDLLCLPNLAPGSYAVQVSPWEDDGASWRPQWFDRAAAFGAAQIVTLDAAGEVGQVTFRLEEGGRIAGRVPAAGGGEEEWPTVFVTDAASPGILRLGRADPEGASEPFRFLITALADGSYKLGTTRQFIYIPGHWGGSDHLDPVMPPSATTWYGGEDWDSAEVITIRDGGTVTGIVLQPPGEVR